jgi:Tol biopolymer transport system component
MMASVVTGRVDHRLRRRGEDAAGRVGVLPHPGDLHDPRERRYRHAPDAQPAAQPSFSPDGARIAYLHDGHIWVMNRDGSAAHEVVSIDASFSPSWSPDGSTIAFTTYDASWRPAASLGSLVGDWPALRVRVLDVKTGRVSAVGKTYMASDVNGPQWLPSGDALLLNLVQKP